MRGVWLLALLIACERGQAATDAGIDAGIDSRPDASEPFPCPCAIAPTNIPPCGASICGNGVRDQCWSRSPMGCKCVLTLQETCDGDTCSDIGYYGSASGCSSNCFQRSSVLCDACGPDATACETADGHVGFASLSTSSSQIAFASGSHVALYDGELQETATATFGTGEVALTAVAGGWLVAQNIPPKLGFLSSEGVAGASVVMPQPWQPFEISRALNGHVLVAWSANVNGAMRAFAAIVSESGAIEVPAMDLFAGELRSPVITTDGVDFLVAGGGHLARITTSGAKTVFDGFPFTTNDHSNFVTWNGNGGVYLMTDPLGGTTLQRFDASGAPTGSTVALSTIVRDVVPDGANLLALIDTVKVNLVAIDVATGAMTTGKEFGAGNNGNRRLEWLGSDVVVAWTRDTHRQIAIGAP